VSRTVAIRRLNPEETDRAASALGAVLLDCVQGGASVSFMPDLDAAGAAAFWRDQASAQAADGRVVLAAEDPQGIVGVVMVIPAWAPNQPHRADVSKMLVHRRARRRGVGEALLRAAEAAARARGFALLTLDTMQGGDAERLYARLGWTAIGTIPDYALWPDGRPGGSTFFYKALA